MGKEERFWAKVDKRGPDECWPWTAAVDGSGYGRFWFAGKSRRASRFSFELANGPVPRGTGYHGNCVCHRCDVRSCVNPSHLFLGATGDNTRDMIAKGRQYRAIGENHGRAKLTEADVLAIRAAYEGGGTTLHALGLRFGVHCGTVGGIVTRARWRHIEAKR